MNEEHTLILPHLDDLTFNSDEVISSSDLFIADISYPSIPLGIEIGRAEVKNKRILCICDSRKKVPSSLKYVNVDILTYDNPEDMVDKIKKYIEKLGE